MGRQSIRRAAAGCALLLAWTAANAAGPGVSFAVDVPARLGGTLYQPNVTVRWDGAAYAADPLGPSGLGAGAHVSAVARLRAGGLLISADAPFVADGRTYGAGDIVLWNGSGYEVYLDAAGMGLPAGTVIDALAIYGNDEIVMSFAEPVTIGAARYGASDLAQWTGSGFDRLASAGSLGLPESANICGLELIAADHLYFTLDAPQVVQGVAVRPGDIVEERAGGASVFFHDGAFPAAASMGDFYFVPGYPGAVPEASVRAEKLSETTVALNWSPACGTEALDYGVYEGALGDWATYVPLTCSTGGATATKIAIDRRGVYWLVVARGSDVEGSYGTDSEGHERPRATTACVANQDASRCP